MTTKQKKCFGVADAKKIEEVLETSLDKNHVRARVKCVLRHGNIDFEVTGYRENAKNTARYFSVKGTLVGTKVMNFIYIRPTARTTAVRPDTAPGARDKLISLSRAIGAVDTLGFENMKIAVAAMEEAKYISYLEAELVRVLDDLNVAVKSLYKNVDRNSK